MDFGTVSGPDGDKLTTYLDAPLYYHTADEKPGDTLGHGFGESWALAIQNEP